MRITVAHSAATTSARRPRALCDAAGGGQQRRWGCRDQHRSRSTSIAGRATARAPALVRDVDPRGDVERDEDEQRRDRRLARLAELHPRPRAWDRRCGGVLLVQGHQRNRAIAARPPSTQAPATMRRKTGPCQSPPPPQKAGARCRGAACPRRRCHGVGGLSGARVDRRAGDQYEPGHCDPDRGEPARRWRTGSFRSTSRRSRGG